MDIVRSKLSSDSSLSYGEKNDLMGMLGQLSPSQASNLSGMLTFVSGAGVGVLIAKFLLHMGFAGQVLFALAGGAIGNSMFGESDNRYSQNMSGEEHANDYDIFGNKRRPFF